MEQEGFHDYSLKNFQIIHGKNGCMDPVTVSIVITDTEHTWNILYKKIKKISINYEKEYDMVQTHRKEHRGFDDYGYDEFFPIDEKTLSHEILFASGATILLYFEKISIIKVKNES